MSSSGEDIRNEIGVRGQQECAKLADSTDGAVFWVFEKETRECKLRGSDEKKEYRRHSVAGYKGCGQKTQEEWDRMMSSDCIREYSMGISSESIRNEIVESQQTCAELTVGTVGGVFWVYNRTTGECNVKRSDEGKEGIEGFVTGNRECGLMASSRWTEILFSDCAFEEGKRYFGRNITSEKVETPRACARLSVLTAGGLYWTFDKATGMCWLFPSEPSSREEQDWVSGNRECGLGESLSLHQHLSSYFPFQIAQLLGSSPPSTASR